MTKILKDTFAGFVNLDHRKDRLDHMTAELKRVGIDAERVPGMLPDEFPKEPKTNVMRLRTPGAIGCHYSQVKVMQMALQKKKHALVMEDDLLFCDDFQERLNEIENFLEAFDWDVFWLGGTFHVNPPYWHPQGPSKMPPNCSANLGRDCERTSYKRIVRTYGAFCTYAYLVNKTSLERVLACLEANVSESIGIDWLFIKLQPELNCFAYVPGSVRQMDSQSDIGDGMTIFSGFSKLNGNIENSKYWFQKLKSDFDPDSFNWAEASQTVSQEKREAELIRKYGRKNRCCS